MPTYVMLANWTDQGARQVKDSPKRVDTARKALTEMGGEFKSLYMTMGDYDLIVLPLKVRGHEGAPARAILRKRTVN